METIEIKEDQIDQLIRDLIPLLINALSMFKGTILPYKIQHN